MAVAISLGAIPAVEKNENSGGVRKPGYAASLCAFLKNSPSALLFVVSK